MPKWISVKDRLPDPLVMVLIYTEGGHITVGFRHSDDYSHWMPLPEAPDA